jgi:hypothetical protein
MPMSTAERQRAYRARLRALGLYPFTIYMTEREKFLIERTLLTMRAHDAEPAMVRTAKGQMKEIDL